MLNDFAQRYFRRNFNLGVVNGIFFNTALAFLSGSTVLPLFVSHLTRSNILIGLSGTMESLGWHLPQAFVASASLHHTRQLPLYKKMAILRTLTFVLLLLSVIIFGNPNPHLLLFLFFLLFTIYSFTGGMAGVAFMDIVGRTIPVNKRGSYFGARMFWGGLLAVLGGILVKRILGDYSFFTAYSIIFGLTLILIISGLISFSLVKEPEVTPAREKKTLWENLKESFSIYKKDPHYKLFLLVRITIGGYVLGYPFYVIYAQQFLKITPEVVGIFLSYEMFGYLITNILWGYLSNKVNNRLVLLLSSIISGIPPLILLATKVIYIPIGIYALSFLFLGATNSGLSVGYMNYLLEIAPEDKRPIYVGFMHSIVAPTIFLGAIGGLIIQVSSFLFLYILVLLIALFSIYLSYKLCCIYKKPA